MPVFHYEVLADVTDINGETRSATTQVIVGYHTLTASVSVNPKLDKALKDHKLNISTNNLNGEFVSAKGTVKIYKLSGPGRVLRPRPWKAPDLQEISKEEYLRLFPNEAYDNEHDANHWEKGKLHFSETFDTSKSKELALGNIKKWPSGAYIIILETTDEHGQVVKDETKTILFSEKDNSTADHQLFSIQANKSLYQIGDMVEVKLASAGKITVTIDVEKDQKLIRKEIIQLNNNNRTITIPVNPNDLGGFVVHYSFAAFNSFEGRSLPINVPYPSTELVIETKTFRDKLKPGQEETWSFKIKGPKGEKVTAELLTSMYDMSLDQFKPHQWSFNPIQRPYYYAVSRRDAGHSFSKGTFRVYADALNIPRLSPQYYDQFNWFGLYFGRSIEAYRMKRSGAMDDSVERGETINLMVTEEIAGSAIWPTKLKLPCPIHRQTVNWSSWTTH